MKPTFITLVGLLASSVAAGPVPAEFGSDLSVRGNGGNGKTSKQSGAKGGNKGGQAGGANNSTANAGGATGGATGGAAKAGNTTALVLPDGRIKQDATPESFNVLESVFKSAVVKGDGK